MDEIRLFSYAKVNLTLEVSGLRTDGYHDIDSIVQLIDIADELVLTKIGDLAIEVTVDAPEVPSGRDNIVYAACREFFEGVGFRAGVRCDLTKSIPAQAGLGGGSGNAAAAIVGLNRLFESGLTDDEMAGIAAKVGSDAPLFIYGGTARMRGRGEIIDVLPDAPELDLVIVKPNTGVSTAWAYAELDNELCRTHRGATEAAARAVRNHERSELVRNLWNDFDPVVSRALDDVRAAKEALTARGAEAVLLSGSGSAVFGVFASREQAESVGAEMAGMFPHVFVSRTLMRRESLPGVLC
ncbi:MAG: 4-(cytidine 5'-diphospho)-2-C-methyl-D-erythritol kinase [Armatimonadetes bacterium]|nr:4-(cytidine 5'-diphospho)-2-C-methyl-D-erythritol kinase [Armatimonadota bacterium]